MQRRLKKLLLQKYVLWVRDVGTVDQSVFTVCLVAVVQIKGKWTKAFPSQPLAGLHGELPKYAAVSPAEHKCTRHVQPEPPLRNQKVASQEQHTKLRTKNNWAAAPLHLPG